MLVSLLSHLRLSCSAYTCLLPTVYRPCHATYVQTQYNLFSSTHVCMRGPGSCLSNYSQCSFEAAVLPIDPNIYTDQCGLITIYFYNRYSNMQPNFMASWLRRLSHKVYKITPQACTDTVAIAYASVYINSVDFGRISTIILYINAPCYYISYSNSMQTQ